MITKADYVNLPYAIDLTHAGLYHAIHSLPYIQVQHDHEVYKLFQHLAAATAVELAVRRFLSEQKIPFTVRKSLNFADHDQYDIFLADRRLVIQTLQFEDDKSFWQSNDPPDELSASQVIMPSEQHRTMETSSKDVYLFASLVKPKPHILLNDRYLFHILPGFWRQPRQWNPLGALTCKYAGQDQITLEFTGLLANQETANSKLSLIPGEQAVIHTRYYSLSSVHVEQPPSDLIGIKSPGRKKVYLIRPYQWKDVWIAGTRVILIGFISLEEFTRRSKLIRPGIKIYPYGFIEEKSLGFPIRELKPVSDLLEHVGIHNPIKTFSA